MITVTREHAEKVVEVLAHGLSSGLGEPEPGKMCVEAAVCYALGLPHGDNPLCVAQSLRQLKIRLNDASWSSNLARAQGLRRLAVAQLGSAGVLDEPEFVHRVVKMTIRTMVPIGMRATATRIPQHAEALESAAVRCEREGTKKAARHAHQISDAVTTATTAAAAATADATAAAGTHDRVLAEYAERVVGILIDLQVPGYQWLDLVP